MLTPSRLEPGFNFNDYSIAQQPQLQAQPPLGHGHGTPIHLTPSPPNGLPFATHAQQSQPTVPNLAHFQHLAATPPAHSSPQTGDKRTSTAASLGELADASRYAVEEDKRRRNTAASARFRVKKKQREQALEKTARDMSDKVSLLEARVGQLEMENQWLKGLITERNMPIDVSASPARKLQQAQKGNGNNNNGNKEVKAVAVEDKAGKVEAETAHLERHQDGERSTDQKKRGVGTVGGEAVVGA